ncbi:Glycosyl transferase, family 2 [Arcticibacter svalbardensis MN12-7]|uniref:Glycosyl transferase, family 2 n=1 Tax=Arcticibacter svalbardensis MN12-7 TaxID=1150600 RepID=R9GQJ0_9SPHI|nr:Glycosyl transferase, family 2 [Arcticibacter svalbardensis MN12-7]
MEIIVIDGGSTDGTVDILKANHPSIAYWKSEKDYGVYDAMNKALDHVSGEWVYFLGADDELLQGFSDLAEELKSQSTIYYGSVLKDSMKYLGRLSDYLHAKTGICHQAMIYPSSVFKKYTFPDDYSISADQVLNMWCWKDKLFDFEFKDHMVAIFNHTGISSVKKDALFEKRKSSLILENYGIMIWLRFLFKRLKESF